ncbi:MAG: glycosyltransferase family 2 protein, partial [bacterium]
MSEHQEMQDISVVQATRLGKSDKKSKPAAVKQPKVALVIVNWNKKQDVLDCLQSIQSLEYCNYKTFVVDNNSSDGSVDAIRENFANIKIICNPENLGGSGGFNRGIEAAGSIEPDYFYLLDNDVILDSGALSSLVDFLEKNKRAGIAGSKIYTFSDPDVIWCLGGRINWWQGKTIHISAGEKDKGQFQKPIEVDYVPACSLLVRHEVVEKVGMLDERFFVYGDDADFCTRVKRAGYKVLCVPFSKIWHKASNSKGNVSPFILYYYFRNNLLFMKKNAQRLQRQIFALFFLFKIFRMNSSILAGWLLKGRRRP